MVFTRLQYKILWLCENQQILIAKAKRNIVSKKQMRGQMPQNIDTLNLLKR